MDKWLRTAYCTTTLLLVAPSLWTGGLWTVDCTDAVNAVKSSVFKFSIAARKQKTKEEVNKYSKQAGSKAAADDTK